MIYNNGIMQNKYSFLNGAKISWIFLVISSCIFLSSCNYFESEQAKLQRTQNLYQENKFNLAIIRLKKILQSDSKSCEARVLLGKSQFAKFGLVEAENSLKTAKREGCKDPDIYTYLARLYFYRNQFEYAKSLFSEPAYSTIVKKQDRQLLEGDFYFLQNNYDKAKSAYDEYYKLSHNAASDCLLMAKLSAMQNRYPEVIEKTQLCEIKFSNNKNYDLDQSRYLRAIAQVKQKQVHKAIATLKEILDEYRNPKDPNIKIQSSILLMDLYLRRNDIDKAAKMADAVLEYVALPKVYDVKAMKYEKDNRYDLAEQQFLNALKLDPNYKPSLLGLANLKFKEGNIEQAQYYAGKIDALTGKNTFTERLDESLALNYFQKGELDSIINMLPHNASESSLKSQYILALAYAGKGEREKAWQVFRQIENNLTDVTQKDLLEARLDVALYDYKKAETIFSRYIKKGNGYAINVLTRLYIQEHKYKQAENLLTDIRNKKTNDITVNLLLAEVYAVSDQRQKLFGLLDDAIKNNAKNNDYKLALAKAYYQFAKYQEAIELCDKIIIANPGFMPAYIIKANSYVRLGKIETAINSYKDFLKQSPNNDYAYLMLSYLAEKKSSPDEALKYADKALEINPRNMRAVYTKINLLVSRNEKDDALNFAKSTTNLLGDKHAKELLLGFVYDKLGDNKKAYLNYKDALAGGLQHNVSVALQMYKLSKTVNGVAFANTELDGFVQKNSELKNIFTVANFFMRTQNYQQATKYYEIFIKHNQRNPIVYNNLAWLKLHDDDIAAAQSYAGKALKLLPASAPIMDTMGQILLRKGDYDKAGSYLLSAYQKLGNNPDVKYHLAQFYYYKDDFDKSRLLLRQVVDSKFAEQGDARKLLEKISQ